MRVPRLRRIAAGTSRKRLFTSTTSAASMATSAPAPMAIPISALVRCRRIIDTVTDHSNFALFLQLADHTSLCHPEEHLRSLHLHQPPRQWHLAVRSLSPVSMTTSYSHILAVLGLPVTLSSLITSATAIIPDKCTIFCKNSGVFTFLAPAVC